MFNILKKELSVIKNFKYSKGDMNLNFSLDIENKKGLENFLELLKVAQEDIQESIDKLKIQSEYHPGAGAGYQPNNPLK